MSAASESPNMFDDPFHHENLHNLKSYHERFDSFLEQFTDYFQFDKFLSTIETSLCNSKPRIISPNVNSIRILLTLSTIDPINRGNHINKEISYFRSTAPIRIRANNIINTLCDISKKNDSDEWNKDDLEIIRKNLIDAISFLETKSKPASRATKKRAATKRSYTELVSPNDSFGDNDFKEASSEPEGSSTSNNKQKANDGELSPRKRAMYQQLADIEDALDIDSTLDLDGNGTTADLDGVEEGKVGILGSLPMEDLLAGDKIWTMIEFALSSSNSSDLMNLQFWQIWEGALTNILHILEVEFEEYKEKKNSASFKETALFSFISANIRYDWEARFVKLLTVPYNSQLKPFQKDDLKLCEGQLLTDFYKKGRSIIVNSKNFRFIRRILTLTFEVLKFNEKVEHSGMWKESTLVREFSRMLLLDANFQDLQAFLIVQRQDIANSNELHVLLKIVRAMIIDLAKVDGRNHRGLAQFDDFKWLNDSHSALYIITLFQTVKLQKLPVDERPKRILERYRKLHFLLMKTLEIWIKVNFNQEKKLPEPIIIQLLEAAEAGDRLRTKDVSTESRSAHPEEIINCVNRKYNTTYLTLYQTLKAQVGDPRKKKKNKKKKTMTTITTTTTTTSLRTKNEITTTTPAKTGTELIHKHGTALSQSSSQQTVSTDRITSAQSVHKRSPPKLKPITKAVQPVQPAQTAQPALPAQAPQESQASISLDNDSDDLMIIGEKIIEKKDETHDNDSDSSVELIGIRKLLIKSEKFKVTDRAGVEVIQID